MILRLCLEEIIHNAMEHGNLCDTSKKIYITLKKDDGLAYIKVRDEGPGFDYAETARRNVDEGRDLLSVRGRGLWIVNHYAENVLFNREGNEVTLVFKL
jgi:serine/threonine-protein kinase RsbW